LELILIIARKIKRKINTY